MAGDSGEHPGTDLLTIMERQDEVGPVRPCQDAMRAILLSLDDPANPVQGRQDIAGLHRRPPAHVVTEKS